MSNPSRILITGFSGFVGRYLVKQCRAHYPNAELFGLCKQIPSTSESSVMREVIPLVADITQPEFVHNAVVRAKPDLVFHLAAQPSVAASWSDPEQTLRVNAGGVLHLLEALRTEGFVPRIILVGSGEQYGKVLIDENPLNEDCLFRPVNPYAVSKAAQDLYGYQYFAAYGLPILRARPFNHFGPHQPAAFVVANFARQISLIETGKAEPVLLVGNLKAQRDFLPVEDVVSAYVAIAKQGRPGEAYNVGSGHPRSIGEILNLLLSFVKVSITVREDQARLRPVDVPLLVADTTRLRSHTDWKPVVDFELALRQTLDYWREAVVSTL